jgi:hypothetical protein
MTFPRRFTVRQQTITMLFERLAIDIAKYCQTVKGACEILRISWEQAQAIRSRLEPIKERV